jgi:hypothetical protein
MRMNALGIEPPQPGTQQRRGLEAFRKHAAAGADESFLPQRVAPVAQGAWRECFDSRLQMRHRLAVAREKRRQRLAMGEVQPATSGHQEFSARRRHRVEDGDTPAALRQHFRRHQPGRAGADDGDLVL